MKNTKNLIEHFLLNKDRKKIPFSPRTRFRHKFTLFETLIVFSLIALIAGVAGISIHKMFVNQRFYNEVSLIVNQLRLAQDLMLILDTDVHLIISEDKSNQQNLLKIESETTLPEEIEKELKRNPAQLKFIKGVFFKDQLPESLLPQTSEAGKIDIKFLSRGTVMSKGILQLASTDQPDASNKVLQNFICLRGAIAPIQSYDSRQVAEQACLIPLEELEFDKQLTRETFGHLPEKMLHPLAPSQSAEAAKKAEENLHGQK